MMTRKLLFGKEVRFIITLPPPSKKNTLHSDVHYGDSPSCRECQGRLLQGFRDVSMCYLRNAFTRGGSGK